LSGDLAVIDTATDTVLTKIPLGKEPNGVSVWMRPKIK
jgi:YVTN family beta-propeller protein